MTNTNSKTILITGATSGIGEATAYAFAKLGWTVLITFHNKEDLAESVVNKCHELGAKESKYYYLDLMDNSSIDSIARNVRDDFKKINVLVNNAGYCKDSLLDETSFENIDKQIITNLSGLVKTTKVLLPIITEQIINIASQYAKESHAEYSVYCGSKWGVRGFTQSLAKEVPNLKIYNVNPGPTKTKMNDFWEGGVEPEVVANVIKDAVLGSILVESGGDVDVWKLV